jgi:hypothetical protein
VSSRAITVVGYVVLVLVGVALQVASRRSSTIPSLRAVVRRVMSSRSGRVGVMAGWAWLGLHFFAR